MGKRRSRKRKANADRRTGAVGVRAGSDSRVGALRDEGNQPRPRCHPERSSRRAKVGGNGVEGPRRSVKGRARERTAGVCRTPPSPPASRGLDFRLRCARLSASASLRMTAGWWQTRHSPPCEVQLRSQARAEAGASARGIMRTQRPAPPLFPIHPRECSPSPGQGI